MAIGQAPSCVSFHSNQNRSVAKTMDLSGGFLPPHVRSSEIQLSYVNELFPDLKDKQYVVLHKSVNTVWQTDYGSKDRSDDAEHLTSHDVSGSPLEYSFSTCDFDNSIIVRKESWRKEEESYLPLNKIDTCTALNSCLAQYYNTDLSVLALCDGKDTKQTRLTGIIVGEDWFTTLKANSIGVTTVDRVRDECRDLVQENFQQLFGQKHDLKLSMLGTFDLFGTKEETIDWDKTAKDDFEGSINVEMHSTTLILDPRLSKNILRAQVNPAWKDSPLKEMRSQLLLLSRYLSVIDEYNKNIGTQAPIKIQTPYLEEDNVIFEKLTLLLNGDYSFKQSVNNDVPKVNYEENTEISINLLERLHNVCLRHDADFTDLFWDILIKTSEYPKMISCIETVLKEIIEHKFMPQINDTNPTRFVKRISDLRHHETISHLLAGSVPLELVADMGFEKLIRDYFYILRGVRFVNLHEIRQKLINVSSGIFITENYRTKLVTLAQIHLCLECMLLIEAHLKYPIESLQSLFVLIYEEFVSAQSPLQHFAELCSRIFTFTTALSNAAAAELSKMDPSTLKASVSSSTVESILTTTMHYSKMPIFPTNLYPTDVNVSAEGILYGISTMSSSVKIKSL